MKRHFKKLAATAAILTNLVFPVRSAFGYCAHLITETNGNRVTFANVMFENNGVIRVNSGGLNGQRLSPVVKTTVQPDGSMMNEDGSSPDRSKTIFWIQKAKAYCPKGAQ